MPRRPRDMYADGVYHITSRGNNKAEIFHDSSDFKMFMQLLLRYKLEFHISIFHYVLMPNHIHLEMRPNGEFGSKFMQKLKSSFARYYSAKYRTIGPIWQGRFHHKHVDTDAYLYANGNYIERNPVRAKLVVHPGDWPYSSYHYYAKGTKDRIIERNPFYEVVGLSDEARRKEYVAQVAMTPAG